MINYDAMDKMDDYQKYIHLKKLYLSKKKSKTKMQKRYTGWAEDPSYSTIGQSEFPGQYSMPHESYSQLGGGKDFPKSDEIHFWSRQLMEHSLILYLGLEEPNLKNEAKKNFDEWESFLNKYFYQKGIIVNGSTITIFDQKSYKEDMVNMDETIHLIDQTVSYINKVVETLEKPNWIGWIFISIVKHMLKETNYFKMKLTNSLSIDEEIKFINDHHSEEMAATAQLIDPAPDQQKTIDIVRSYALKSMSKIQSGQSLSDASPTEFPKYWTENEEEILKGTYPSEQSIYLAISTKFSRELTEFANASGKKIKSGMLKTIILHELADHIYREFARFTMRLEMING